MNGDAERPEAQNIIDGSNAAVGALPAPVDLPGV
jgi:hypothetical protein